MTRSRKLGFTLIELLVVIAIIAILAAILFPVFAQAREKARAVSCLSNGKNIGTALLMYGQDYDEAIPPWLLPASSGLSHKERLWTGLIQPYVKNGGTFPPDGIFKCPSYSENNLFKASDAPECDGTGANKLEQFFPATETYANYGIAFGMDQMLGPDGTTNCGDAPSNPCRQYPGSEAYPPNPFARHLADVVRPAETAIVSDGVSMWTSGVGWVITFGCEAAEMHQGGGNFIFIDGHAKRISRNAERYLAQNASGLWYEKYFTFSQE